MRVTVCAMLVALGSMSCQSQAKKNLVAFNDAQAKFTAALSALQRSELDAAHQHFCEMDTAMLRLRASTAPPMSEDPGDGPVVLGQSARSWHTQWVQQFKDAVEAQVPSLVEQVNLGTLDWSRGRSFLTTYRPDLDAQWLEALKGASAAELRSLKDTILFRCQSANVEVCDALRVALASKSMRPLTQKVLLEGDSHRELVGLMTVDVSYAEWRSYAGLTDPTKHEVFSLPAVLAVAVDTQTHHGSSSWDGARQLHARHEPPTSVSADSLTAISEAHFKALLDDVLAQLARWPAQSPE